MPSFPVLPESEGFLFSGCALVFQLEKMFAWKNFQRANLKDRQT